MILSIGRLSTNFEKPDNEWINNNNSNNNNNSFTAQQETFTGQFSIRNIWLNWILNQIRNVVRTDPLVYTIISWWKREQKKIKNKKFKQNIWLMNFVLLSPLIKEQSGFWAGSF